MDNFFLDVVSEGEANLDLALKLAFSNHTTATHYRVVRMVQETAYYASPPTERMPANLNSYPLRVHHSTDSKEAENGHLTLILYWTKGDVSPALEKLPFPLSLPAAIAFVKGWLGTEGDPGKQPDHDGDNEKGFRVFVEGWGHVLHDWRAIVGVQATWAMYGK